MGPSDENLAAGNSAFDAVLGEYLRRVDAGENVDLAAFAAAHPEVAADLKAYFATAALLERIGGPASDGDSHSTLSIDTARGLGSQETIPPSQGTPGQPVQTAGRSAAEGTLFGRYRLVRVLGQGAMGVVHLALDTELDREVALKVPKFTQADAPELIERFYREARSAAALNHRNICPLFDIGEIDGMRYITMAYIDGRPLSDFISSDKPIAQRQIAGTVRKLALALAVAHERGVIHRDLKPANILIDRSKEPVIMDFGLARQINKPEDVRITQSGALVGSPAYMSPEQVESRLDAIGPQSDIYSLGVILYEILTGQLPFQGSIASVIGQIISVEPKKPSERRADVDKTLESICQKMMSKKIENRYASMQEVADALLAYLKDPPRGADARSSLSGLNLPAAENLQPVSSTAKPSRATSGPRKQATQEEYEALYRTAQKCVRAHDYEQAVDILDQVPDEKLTAAMRRLRDRAQETQDEVDLLLADIEDTRHHRNQEGLQQKVERLLQLKPGHDYARQLQAKLTARSHREPSTVKLKLGPLGNFRIPVWAARTAMLGLAGLLLYGVITLFFRIGKETVKVEIDPQLLAQENVTITFNEEEGIEIRNIGDTIRVTPGENTYVVHRGDVRLTGGVFTVVRGENPVLVIAPERSATPAPAETKSQQARVAPQGHSVGAAGTSQTSANPAGVVAGDDNQTAHPGAMLTLLGHKASIRDVAISPDSRWIVSCGNDGLTAVWDAATGKQVHALWEKCNAAAFSPDGQGLALATFGQSDQNALAFLHVGDWKEVRRTINSDRHANALAFAPDSKSILVSHPKAVWLIDVASGNRLRQFERPNLPAIEVLAFTAEGKVAFGNGYQSKFLRWDVESGKLLASFDRDGGDRSVLAPNGKFVMSSSWHGGLRMLDFEAGSELRKYGSYDRGIGTCSVAVSANSRFALSGGHDKHVRLFDVESGKELATFGPHKEMVHHVKFAPNGHFALSACGNVWDNNKIRSGTEHRVFIWDLSGYTAVKSPTTDGESKAAAPVTGAGNVDDWIELFNGKDLSGWSQDENYWKVESGTIAAHTQPQTRGPRYLVADENFADFELTLQFRLQNEGNCGVMFRSAERQGQAMTGPHVEIGYGEINGEKVLLTGALIRVAPGGAAALSNYDANLRHRVSQSLRKDGWNDLSLKCEGSHVVVAINGIQTVDYRELKGPASGYIALQSHRGAKFRPEVAYRNIRLRRLVPESTLASVTTPPVRAQKVDAISKLSTPSNPPGPLVFKSLLSPPDTLDMFYPAYSQYGGKPVVEPGTGLRMLFGHTAPMVWAKPYLGDKYLVQFEVQSVETGWAGWTLNGPGYGNSHDAGYGCYLEKSRFSFRRDGVEVQSVELPDPPAPGEWAGVQAEVSGGKIAVAINGVPVAQFTDPKPLTGSLNGWFGMTAAGSVYRNLSIWSSERETSRQRQLTPPVTDKPAANGKLLYEGQLIFPPNSKTQDLGSEWWKSQPEFVAIDKGAVLLSGPNGTPAIVLDKPLEPNLACEVEFEYPGDEAVNFGIMLCHAEHAPRSAKECEGWRVELPVGNGNTIARWHSEAQDGWGGFESRSPILASTGYYAPIARRKHLARIETQGDELRLFVDGGFVFKTKRPDGTAAPAKPVFLVLRQFLGGSKLHAVRVYEIPATAGAQVGQ